MTRRRQRNRNYITMLPRKRFPLLRSQRVVHQRLRRASRRGLLGLTYGARTQAPSPAVVEQTVYYVSPAKGADILCFTSDNGVG